MIYDYLAVFFVLYFLFDVVTEKLETRKKSWFLSLLVSARFTYEAIVYSLHEIDYKDTATQAFSSNARADETCDIFLAYCLCDLVCAALSYPKDFKVVEGFIHHILYFMLISILKAQRWTCLFWLCTFCEIPTLIMAAGKMFDFKSNDFKFCEAVTFWIFRIMLYLIYAAFFFATLNIVHYWWTLPLFSLIISAHLHWGIILIKRFY